MQTPILDLLSATLAAAPAAGQLNWLTIAANAVLLLLLVSLSASFSGSEAVLFSLSHVQLERQAKSSNPFRRRAARLMRNPKRTLLVILVGNTSLNVLLFANSYVLFNELSVWLGAWSTILSAVISVFLVMVCGEAIPKTLGVNLNEKLVPFSAALLQFSGIVLNPVSRVLDWFMVRPIERLLFGSKEKEPRHDLSIEELNQLLQMSSRHGHIRPMEDAFLREVIDLNYMRVRDVMVPRVEVRAFSLDDSPEGLRDLIRESRLKKIPVYEESIDNIVGLIYAKILFLEPGKPLRDLVMPVRFVPEVMTGDQLLRHFRKTRTQLAIVVDEYGGMAGLVTLEDVLEEIVGDIRDPEDAPPEPELVTISDREYEISGGLSIRYWADMFGLPRLSERVATVGGLVMTRLGRPARPGDSVRLGNIELRVLSVQRRRVDRLRVRLVEPQPEAAAR